MNRGNPIYPLTFAVFAVMLQVKLFVGDYRGRRLMAIEKIVGRTIAGAPKKSPEAPFGVARAITLALLVGLAALSGGLLLLVIAII